LPFQRKRAIIFVVDRRIKMSEHIQRWMQWVENRFQTSADDLDLLKQVAHMQGPVRVVVDSGSDLPPRLAKLYGITVVPLVVRFGEQTFLDTDLSRDDFWHHASGRFHPQTSQPSVGTFENAFEALIQDGAIVLCIAITARHSGTYNAAWAAAQRFPGKVLPWDSQSLSLGITPQAIEAATMAQEGHSLQDIVERLEHVRRNTRVTILLDTIEYVRRGGRLEKMIAVAERLVQFLEIRPLLHIIKGQVRILGAARSYRQGLRRLLNEALAAGPLCRLAVVHTRRPDDAAGLAERLSQKTTLPKEEILICEAGPTLSTHAGPGAVGVVAVTETC
jgi:DegV family protein with EDD domain